MTTNKAQHGGARAGAGRPRKEFPPPAAAKTPLDFLLALMNDTKQDPKLRLRAAIAAAQYVHTRRHDGGKKDEAERLAKAAGNRFKPAAPPLGLVRQFSAPRKEDSSE